MLKRFHFFLLIIAFLGTQLFSAAHAVEHSFEEHQHQTSFCEVCLDSKNLKFSISQSSSLDLEQINFITKSLTQNSIIVSSIYYFTPRAPPILF